MKLEFIGKFYDNHSLTIINRNIITRLSEKFDVYITSLDKYDPQYKVDTDNIKKIKELEAKDLGDTNPEIQIRHTYPPLWNWPISDKTKVVYIQPWEYPKVPFEWQYKFETFADALIVPSNYVKQIFLDGGLNPSKTFVVPNGYNPKFFNKDKTNIKPMFGVNPDKFNFLFVGNSQWRKGLDILINVWHKCFKKYDKCSLIIKDNPNIYGKNNILNEVIKMEYKTESAEVIYIDDNLSDTDMANLYKLSNVLVHPYRAEGFAMHVQEAIACGCLPVVPSGGPTADFVSENIGLNIPTSQQNVNISDPGVFAMKPGDSMTRMSTHTFINEPSGQHLEQVLKYIYHHHNKQDLYKKLDDVSMKNTWDSVVDMYEGVINDVKERKGTQRAR